MEKDNDSNRASWTEPQRAFLVSLLMEYSTAEHRTDNNGWTREAWTEIVERFAERFPAARFNRAQIKDQQQRLRKQLASLKRVLGMSGVGWNDDLKRIDFQDAAVEEALLNDKEVRQWHGKPFPYYNDLCELYKGTTLHGIDFMVFHKHGFPYF
jgi:Myb/SANT-like DNA-binding domain